MSLQIEDFKRRHADDAELKSKIYGELREAGTKDYKAICGVCGGNDLSVSKNLPTHYCFNCHTTGDDFDYLQKVKGISFHESLIEVVGLVGEHPEDFHQLDEKAIAKMRLRKKKIELAEKKIGIFFDGLINSPRAKAYLEARKISIPQAQKAKVGYIGKEDLGKINALLLSNDLPTLGQHYGDRIAIPVTGSPLGVSDFTFRAIDNDVQPKYLNSPGFDKSGGFSGLSSLKKGNEIKIVESYLEAAIFNGCSEFHQSDETWLGLGDCSVATPERLRILTKIVKDNEPPVITFVLDSDVAGYRAVCELLEQNALKLIRPILKKCFFFCWDKIPYQKTKDIFDLMTELGYNYRDAVGLLNERQYVRNIYEFLVLCCFGSDFKFSSELIPIDSREIELGINKLLSAIRAFGEDDKLELDLALSDRFKDSPAVLDKIRTRVSEEFEKIGAENYVNDVKDWAKKLENCSSPQFIDRLLESLPKKEILSIPVHQAPLTDNDWASTTKLTQTYYDVLDRYIAFTLGGFHIVGGRPGDGKSTFLLNIARSQLRGDSNSRVLILTLEEAQKALFQKLLLCDADVIFDDDNIDGNYKNFLHYLEHRKIVKNGKSIDIDSYNADKIAESKAWINQCISDKRLTILSPPTSDVDNIVKLMSEYNKYYGYDFICLDYLQLMTSSETKEQNYLLGKMIANSLASFALNNNVVLLAGSQLNRAVESRKESRPILGDLRESGDYEQKACLVVGLSTPKGITKDSDQEAKDVLEFTVMKNREGTCSSHLTLSFKRCTRRILNRFRTY